MDEYPEYAWIAARMLCKDGDAHPNRLEPSFLESLRAVDGLCAKDGGFLMSRQIIAVLALLWTDRNTDTAIAR